MLKKEKSVDLDNIRHSLAHLLAAAVLKQFPDAKLGIGPTIQDGFYYDFLLPRTLKPEDLKGLEKDMKRMISASLPFSGKKLTPAEAKKTFKDQPFKLDLIKEFSGEKRQLTQYTVRSTGSRQVGDFEFVDLCRGGHVKNTKEINVDAFKLDRIAGAYWRGDEKNEQLQRIYGLAFSTKKELEDYLKMREEAERRDHKKLGPKLDLFTFSELVGAGLPLWTPKGTVIRNELDNFVWSLRKAQGFEKVEIPHIAKKDLFEKSGHWGKFRDDMFQIVTREKHTFAMKPMNCPHHTQIYNRRKWSYKELPQKYANTTMVYRDEQSGELAGLVRVRSITQDDAHVFCRQSQVEEELMKVWDIIEKFYGAVGFKLDVRLSLHDPKEMKKYLGTPAGWKKAESQLRSVAKKRGVKTTEEIGEAAFYGPKIDFMAKDSIGREWQVATIQLDMNLPERFDLSCVNEKGKDERIIMIHAAIMGAIERYMAILIEHFAGAFPVWLSPVQIEVINVGAGQLKYAGKICEELKKEGLRAKLNDENLTVGKKIRKAEIQKVPYILVLGEKEERAKTVNVRRRGMSGTSEIKLDKLIEQIKSEVDKKIIQKKTRA